MSPFHDHFDGGYAFGASGRPGVSTEYARGAAVSPRALAIPLRPEGERDVLVVLGGGAEADEAVADLRGWPRHIISGPGTIDATLRGVGPIYGILVVPTPASVAQLAGTVKRTRRRFAELSILVWLDGTPSSTLLVAPLVRAGADDVVLKGGDMLHGHLHHMRRAAAARKITVKAFNAVAGVLPSSIRDILACCLDEAVAPLSVGALSRATGVHRRTLSKRMMQAGMPTPSAMIAWARLLHAAGKLSESGVSVEHAALSLGFGSATALRNMLRRHTGLRVEEVRGPDGAERLIALFRARVLSPVDETEGGIDHCGDYGAPGSAVACL